MSQFFDSLPINGIEALRNCSDGADVDIAQLSRGEVKGEIQTFDLGNGVITAASFSGDVRVRGPMSTECLSMAVMLSRGGPTREWGINVKPGDVGIYPRNYESDSSHRGALGYAILTITPEDLQVAAIDLEIDLCTRFLKTPGFFRTDQQNSASLQGFFRSMLRATQVPSQLEALAVRKAMLDDALRLFLTAAKTATQQESRPQTVRWNPHAIVRKTEDYLQENLHRPVPQDEICKVLGISKSHLHRAFLFVLQEPPATYLRRWRLSQVRTYLVEQAALGRSVTEAATEFGFWELGRFAGQYRSLFGELPSQTHRQAIV